jgi:hypothetical protein
MNDQDAVVLAAFEDEARPSALAAPGVRPPDRPRPVPSSPLSADPIALAVADSDETAENGTESATTRERPALAFDIGLFDPKTAAFLVLYAAGTPLDALQPRTVSVPSRENGSQVTSLDLYVRASADAHPTPFVAFRFPQDVGGRQLTLRFADPSDPGSVRVECAPDRWLVLPETTPPALRPSQL